MTPTRAFEGSVVVVTGGGSGIGKALCFAFSQAGASVIVADLRGAHAVRDSLPSNTDHMAVDVDVTSPTAVSTMIRHVKQRYQRINIYCSNAGIMIPTSNPKEDSCVKHSLSDWNKIFQVNVFSHVTAFSELVEDWERGEGDGIFCVTASAAGLLTMVGDASYGVSKSAALSFCEHVAISHPSIKIHCLCPQAVDTPLVPSASKESNAAMADGLLSPGQVAAVTLKGILRQDFFIFPHPEVPKYALRKAEDHTRWLKGMRRLRSKLMSDKSSGPLSRSKL